MVEGSAGRALTSEYVEFRASGERASGEHRCSGCCYGVVVHDVLPRCPMCGGETWEPVRRAYAPPSTTTSSTRAGRSTRVP